MNYEEEITRLKDEISKLTDEWEAKGKFWEPKNNNESWYINTRGQVVKAHRWTKQEIEYGVAYKTEEEANKAICLQFAIQRLKKAIFSANDGIKYPFVNGRNNYCVGLRNNELESYGWMMNKTNPNWMYLRNEEVGKQLIESHREDLELYLKR